MFLQDLTVYVISTGEDTRDDCLKALHAQDCTFTIEHVRGVHPMSAAFQAMPDRCTTKYFTQVDADIILNPDAISTLYEGVQRSAITTYMVSGALFEEGFGIGGAVKCWKRSVFRLAKFRDVRTVDRDLHRRLRRLGLRRRHLTQVMGIHRPRHSDFSLYLKAKSDVEKWRFLKRPGDMYALGVLEEALAAWPADRHRLAGLLLGALSGPARVIRSKDVPLEADRFRKVLGLLGRDEDLSDTVEMNADLADRIRSAFVAAHDDFRGASRAKRETVVELVFDVFSRGTAAPAPAAEFLEVIDR